MKTLLFSFALLTLAFGNLKSQDKKAFQIYNSKGEVVNFQQIVEKAAESDVVLFGEFHDNPVIHWLQYELTQELYEKIKDKLILGAEMFETDDQIVIDEYLEGFYKEKNFKPEAKLWNNYDTDYKPLLEFAKKKKLKFIATNIPRRYAAMVNNGGFEALQKLSDEAKKLIAPLPIAYDSTLSCYKNMMNMGGEGGMPGMMGGHKMANLPKAQAIKDATMAYFLLKNFKKGNVFLHYQGAYHSDFGEGIGWYLKKADPSLKILIISPVQEDNAALPSEKDLKRGDFIISVDKDMTSTH